MNNTHHKLLKCYGKDNSTINKSNKVTNYTSNVSILKYNFRESDADQRMIDSNNDIIINGKFNDKTVINRVLSQKVSNIYNMCSASICCSIDNKSYIITIIPKTPQYLTIFLIYQK